jgi:glycosyltransferase involved in cell wall biosynthesis
MANKKRTRNRQKTKILWIGDAVATTGFARVNHSVITNLPRRYDIHHLGINYMGDPHEFDYKIYPALLGGDVYGINRITELVKNIKPDIIFILNDPWIIDTYLDHLVKEKLTDIPIVVYFPVDAEEHDPSWFRHYQYVYATCTYTDFAKQIVLGTEQFEDDDDIIVIPHGSDPTRFFPYPNENGVSGDIIARQELYPYKDNPKFLNSFIILNANRNQPRKRIDITMRAFAEFHRDKKDVKLYCHMGTVDMGVDILKLAKRYNFDEDFIISSTTQQIPGIPDQRLNLIYNGCDVGINTSMGEGWGLTSWEQASARKAQLVPRHSALEEIWEDAAIFIEPSEERYMYDRINTLATIPSHNGTVEAMNVAYDMWHDGSLRELDVAAYELTQKPEYSWKHIAKKFDKIFQDIVR